MSFRDIYFLIIAVLFAAFGLLLISAAVTNNLFGRWGRSRPRIPMSRLGHAVCGIGFLLMAGVPANEAFHWIQMEWPWPLFVIGLVLLLGCFAWYDGRRAALPPGS